MTNQSTREKKIEVIVIALTTIVVAFIVSFIASYTYDSLKGYQHINIVVLVAFLILILTLGILYKTIFSNIGSKKIDVTVPLAFSRTTSEFMDLPYNMLSVQTRINFNSLPQSRRAHLTTYDGWGQFFGSELNRFLNQSIQSSIITRMLHGFKFKTKFKSDHLDSDKLPNCLKENQYLKDWLKEEGKIYGPRLTKIECFGPNNSFLRIDSDYGEVQFSWRISYNQAAPYSEFFFDEDEMEPIKDYHDYAVILTLTCSFNPWKIYSTKGTNFTNWCEELITELQTYDWSYKNPERMLSSIKKLKN
jgi:hypothetical protein